MKTEPKKITEAQIELLMERFDFETVYKHMVLTGWKWSGSDSPDGVPRMDEIKATAKKILTGFENDCLCSGTGGFMVRLDSLKNPILAFEVEASDVYDR